MVRRLFKVQERVEESAIPFYNYLEERLGFELFKNLVALSTHSTIYIFSGVIRNFFLRVKEFRDIDIVLTEEVDIENVFNGYDIKKNSFGGFKISKGEEVIDLWYVKNTWGLKFSKPLEFNEGLEKFIPYTAFFNFSSIVFSFNEKKFYYTAQFLRFLQYKKIDMVFEPNANYALCVLNTIYYCEKYRLGISPKLKRHIRYLHKYLTAREYEAMQLKHFGRKLYSDDEIENKIYSAD